MRKELSEFALYYFQMFFAYEAVFIALLLPKSTQYMPEIVELFKSLDESVFTKASRQVIKDVTFWSKHFPIWNNYFKKATIVSLTAGIPVILLLYYWCCLDMINISNGNLVIMIYVTFSYMIIKLFYFFFQWKRSKDLLHDLRLVFSPSGDKELAAKFIDNCDKLDSEKY